MKHPKNMINRHKHEISALAKTADTSALLAQVQDLQAQIAANAAESAAQIAALEQKLQAVGGAQNVGTSVAQISALMDDFIDEPDFSTGAAEKLQFGTQCAADYAPHARIFFRQNPLKTTKNLLVSLKFWLSPLPADITSIPAIIALNGQLVFRGSLNVLASTGVVAQLTMELSRQSHPPQVFNVLEITFFDGNLANTFLDWIEVEITNSHNCIILNRSTDHEIYGVKRPEASYRLYDNYYHGQGYLQWSGGDDVDLSSSNRPFANFAIYSVNEINMRHQKRFMHHVYNYYNDLRFLFYVSSDYEYKISQANRFYIYSTYFSTKILETTTCFVDNVLYANHSLHNGEGQISNACCVHQDFTIGTYRGNLSTFYYLTFLNKIDFLLNNEEYPAEFVDFIPIKDFFLSARIGYQNVGYFLLHQSGNILFVPSMNSPYFITLGKGRQVNAFLSESGNEIFVTYQYNKGVIKKTLIRESPESDWKLSGSVETFLDIQELYICGDKKIGISNGNLLNYQ